MQKYSNLSTDTFKLISFCPLCGKHYNPANARILLSKNQNTHLVYVKCDFCLASIVALVVNGEMGVSSIGLVTDLYPEEVLKYMNFKEIKADDILEIHNRLKKKKFLEK